jgi:hypothetical protein
MAGVLKTVAAAKSQDWHPVLDGYARGVESMIHRDAQLTVLVATTFWKDSPWGMR